MFISFLIVNIFLGKDKDNKTVSDAFSVSYPGLTVVAVDKSEHVLVEGDVQTVDVFQLVGNSSLNGTDADFSSNLTHDFRTALTGDDSDDSSGLSGNFSGDGSGSQYIYTIVTIEGSGTVVIEGSGDVEIDELVEEDEDQGLHFKQSQPLIVHGERGVVGRQHRIAHGR